MRQAMTNPNKCGPNRNFRVVDHKVCVSGVSLSNTPYEVELDGTQEQRDAWVKVLSRTLFKRKSTGPEDKRARRPQPKRKSLPAGWMT